MPPVSVDRFASALRGISTSSRTAFVAALWTARGWETAATDGVIVANRDGKRRRIRVVDPGRFGAPNMAGIDTLVTARDRKSVREAAASAGVEYVSPNDLHDLLLYGVERATAAELYERWFDEPLLQRAPEAGTNAGESNRSGPPTGVPFLLENKRILGALILVLLVGIVVTGPSLTGGTTPAQSPVAGEQETLGGVDGVDSVAPSPSSTEDTQFPPGVSPAGVGNASALAEAHVSGVRGRSRIRSLNASGPWNATFMAGAKQRNESIRVQNETNYRADSVSIVTVENQTMAISSYAANGSLYQRAVYPDGIEYSPTGSVDYYRYPANWNPATQYDEVETYLELFFEGAESTVVTCAIDYDTDCPTYRLEVTGEPPATISASAEEYRALAIVSDTGVITTIRVTYTVPNTDGKRVQAAFALDYRFEDVELSPPAWLPEEWGGNKSTTTETGRETPTPTE